MTTAHASRRAEFRAAFPDAAAFVDAVRAAGFEPRVRYVTDGTRSVGTPPVDDGIAVPPPNESFESWQARRKATR